jgi:hypothetical protein
MLITVDHSLMLLCLVSGFRRRPESYACKLAFKSVPVCSAQKCRLRSGVQITTHESLPQHSSLTAQPHSHQSLAHTTASLTPQPHSHSTAHSQHSLTPTTTSLTPQPHSHHNLTLTTASLTPQPLLTQHSSLTPQLHRHCTSLLY